MKIWSFSVTKISVLSLLFLVCGTSSVMAQRNSLPPLGFPTASELREMELKVDPLIEKQINIENEYLGNTIQLQFQISLLNQMIQRQGGISRLQEAYSSLGVPFEPPPPPRSICEELPLNMPCHRAYPRLYKYTFTGAPIPDPLDITELMDEPEPVEVPDDAYEVTTDFTWAEIRCKNLECQAVITEDDRENTRRTVVSGDILADGAEIIRISVKGVQVLKEKTLISLNPSKAPSRGGPESPIYTRQAVPESVRDILERKKKIDEGEEAIPDPQSVSTAAAGATASAPAPRNRISFRSP